MQRLFPTAPTIEMSADQTSSYFLYPKESQKPTSNEAPLYKSTARLMYNHNSNQQHNNISALVSLSTTDSQFHLSASDATTQSLATACEPTPFADGIYLQPLTENSKTLFVPRQEDCTNDTTPRTYIHCNHQSINSQLLRDERLSDSMEDSDDYDADDQSRTSSNAAHKKHNSKYFQHQEERWIEHFQSLLRYKAMYGNCHVPQKFPQNPALAQWSRRQRHQFKLNRQNLKPAMSKERQLMLEQVGFVWDPQMDSWEIRRQELQAYKERHGHCNVPSRYAENPGLATWVKRQRTAYRQFQSGEKVSRVRKERLEILTKMGLVWNRSNK